MFSVLCELPGREVQLEEIHQFLLQHVNNESAGSMYISGPPGTGKSASLNVIIRRPEVIILCRSKENYFYLITMKQQSFFLSCPTCYSCIPFQLLMFLNTSNMSQIKQGILTIKMLCLFQIKDSFKTIYINCNGVRNATSVYETILTELKLKAGGKSERHYLAAILKYFATEHKSL